MANQLPARPNLDHLRKQAKTLLADLKAGEAHAARTFITHLPEARRMTPAKVRMATFRLADAQSAIARQHGFDSWNALTRHVEQLRQLEGEWAFVELQVDGTDVPAAMTAQSRLLIDGDRFRMESPEAKYEGTFAIDAGVEPMRIDIAFVEGPEAGQSSYGIYALNGDQLTMCLGVVGASRPAAFASTPGSGHALERLRRTSAARPAEVTGGTSATPVAAADATPDPAVDAASFDVPMTPLLKKLQGDWVSVVLVQDGTPLKAEWLPFGSRSTTGNVVKIVFGGQVMVHAKMKIDEGTTPMAVDYLNLAGSHKGRVSPGIMDWVGDDVRFLVASPGQPRPSSFDAPGKGQTLSIWRRG